MTTELPTTDDWNSEIILQGIKALNKEFVTRTVVVYDIAKNDTP